MAIKALEELEDFPVGMEVGNKAKFDVTKLPLPNGMDEILALLEGHAKQ